MKIANFTIKDFTFVVSVISTYKWLFWNLLSIIENSVSSIDYMLNYNRFEHFTSLQNKLLHSY